MKEVYSQIICEKTSIINDLIELYKESGSTKAIVKQKIKTESDINVILAKKDKLLDLVMDDRISNEEFEQRNNAFNEQIEELKARLSELSEEERKSLDLKESIESLRGAISNELDFTDNISKNVVDSFIDKIVVFKGDAENEINLKIFLKLLPGDIQNFTENAHTLTFANGQLIQTRGGNSRSLKAYDLTFRYDLCYCLE